MKTQFYQNQLSILKKANMSRKLKLTEKAGYDTIETYQKSLESVIKFHEIERKESEPIYSKSKL